MKTALVVLSATTLFAWALLSVTGCKPSGAVTTAGAVTTTPVQPDETPAPEMTDAEAASAMAMVTPGPQQSCAEAIGREAAQKLVDRCIAVSTATHPPCNAENTCKVIQDEIDRSCAAYGAGEKKPAECTG